MNRIILIAAIGIITLFSTQGHAADWAVDQSHSSLNFKTKHLVFTTVRGTFDEFEGTVSLDPGDLSTIQAAFTAQIASINTDNDGRDEHLRGSDFFDAEHHPTMTFQSKMARQTAPGKAELTGDLTIRGVTKEVTFMVDGFHQSIDFMGTTKIGGIATATINRQDFGVSWNRTLDNGGLVVSDNVDIEIELELDKQN